MLQRKTNQVKIFDEEQAKSTLVCGFSGFGEMTRSHKSKNLLIRDSSVLPNLLRFLIF